MEQSHPDSGLWTQAELELDDVRRRIPWGGRSPRGLTAGYAQFTLKARAEKSASDFVSDEEQYDLWLPIKKAPWEYQGAPSLLPLREDYHGSR